MSHENVALTHLIRFNERKLTHEISLTSRFLTRFHSQKGNVKFTWVLYLEKNNLRKY